MDVEQNLHKIQKRINEAAGRAGRNPEEIKIIAVTKYVSPERALEAVEAGVVNLGENRPDGLLKKQETIQEDAVWHFIGSLQSRKVKSIIERIDVIHSLDRLSLAAEIQKRATHVINCLVQVNISGEESKHGIKLEETTQFIKKLVEYDKIRVIGLMTMAPFTEDKVEIRRIFRKLKELQVEIQKMDLPTAPCNELSMGMSNDFEIAVEEGSTMVRIGTALVGNDKSEV